MSGTPGTPGTPGIPGIAGGFTSGFTRDQLNTSHPHQTLGAKSTDDLIVELSRTFSQAGAALQNSADKMRLQLESYEQANKTLRERNLLLHERTEDLRDRLEIYKGIIETLKKEADARAGGEEARAKAQESVEPGAPATRKDVWRVEQEIHALRAENRALADTVRVLVAKLEAQELLDR